MDRGWAAREDHGLGLHLAEGLLGLLKRHDLAIDLLFAHASRDELRHLRPEIDDQKLVVHGNAIWRAVSVGSRPPAGFCTIGSREWRIYPCAMWNRPSSFGRVPSGW